ncbi:MAG: FKBP-type peptidyl-prolyl cis-trans isomerase [Planctomycetia bacterium]
MRMSSLFPSRSPATATKRSRRSRRGKLRAGERQLGAWEQLGLGLAGHEALEQRALMAADLSLSFNDNLVAGIERTFYSPGTQVIYTLKVTNNGPDTATDALVKTSLSSTITNETWTAVYTGGGTGLQGGAGDLGTHTDQKTKTDFGTTVTLPSGATATFTIVGTVPASATGKLTSTASVTLDADTKTVTDENTFVPRAIAVGNNGSWTSASTVRLVNPVNGSLVAGPVTPYAGLRNGVRAVMADLTGDGKAEVVCVPNYGTAGQIVVYSQNVAGDGSVTLVKNPGYTLMPFGSEYIGGMTVAAGDFDGDRLEDLAFGQSSAEGQVKVYLSTPAQPASPLTLSRTFTPFATGLGVGALGAGDFGTFTGATADAVRQDGKDELVVTSGIGAAPQARVYNVVAATPTVVDTIRPFAAAFKRGFSVEVANLNADSTPDLVFTAASGGGSGVEIYDGTVASAANRRLAKFAVFSGVGRGSSVFAAAVDSDGDTRAEAIDFVQGGGPGAAMVRYAVGVGSSAGSITTSRINSVAAVAGTLRAAAASIQADPGLIRTTSGLMYKELKRGTGEGFVSSRTGVRVNYQGYNSDGDRFDSGSNVPFSLGLGSLISGFTEGLKTMKEEGTSQFVIPPNLAYGNGAPSNGKPIIFIVDLLAFT